jgi:hypothetical protein
VLYALPLQLLVIRGMWSLAIMAAKQASKCRYRGFGVEWHFCKLPSLLTSEGLHSLWEIRILVRAKAYIYVGTEKVEWPVLALWCQNPSTTLTNNEVYDSILYYESTRCSINTDTSIVADLIRL